MVIEKTDIFPFILTTVLEEFLKIRKGDVYRGYCRSIGKEIPVVKGEWELLNLDISPVPRDDIIVP